MTKNMLSLFKGFVPTKDKVCVMPFKGKKSKQLLSYEEVKDYPEYAGVLADDTILIDIDDSEQAEIAMDIIEDLQLNVAVNQTTRGKHIFAKNDGVLANKTDRKLAIGLDADIKLGSKSSYAVLKYKGEERFTEWDIEDNAEYQTIPRWLHPLNSNQKLDFLDMEAGDGRNQSLFNYILTLQSNDFSKEEARETIRLINQFVLKDPLSEGELETVLRDDAFKKPIFFMGTTFLFDKFATFLKNNHHIIKINNQLHIYKNGIYISGLAEIEAEMIKHIPQLNRAKRTEVLAYLDILIMENTKAEDANLIAFENGLYNIVDDSFVEFTPEHIITNKIRWNYCPEAYSELADKTLDKIACGDPAIRALLEEAIGYCFYRRNELGKAFILTGDKSNGKSTFLSMVQTLLGEENIASLDLKELGDRFKTAEMFGKLANIGDDIGDEFIANPAIFKKLVTGERISAERKGQNPFEFNNYSKLLFSANNIPRIKDKTGAVQRRLTIIPFDARFTAADPDFNPYIKHLLKTDEVMQYLINLGIAGLKRVLTNRQFTVSSKVQQAMDEYEENNNPILGFFKECEAEDFQIENEPTNKVYKRYQEYCLANSLQPMSNIEFSKQVNRILNMRVEDKKISGKKYRIFVRAD